jgi:hypothetical protein
MTLCLVFSAFTSRPVSILATAKAYVFFFVVCMLRVSLVTEQNEWGLIFVVSAAPQVAVHKIKFCIMIHVTDLVNNCFFVQFKCYTFLMFLGSDTDMPVCCASCIGDVLGISYLS